MNLEEKAASASSMDLVNSPSPDQNLYYIRCNFCNTVLAVSIPLKRLMDTLTVKCGHCGNLTFLSSRPPTQGQRSDPEISLEPFDFVGKQGLRSDFGKVQSSSSSSCISTAEPLSPRAPFVVKPPEKKHRLPSAYNRFMKEEIQRIKAANPEIPHREAFSSASKNWARYIPNSAGGSASGKTSNE